MWNSRLVLGVGLFFCFFFFFFGGGGVEGLGLRHQILNSQILGVRPIILLLFLGGFRVWV